MRNINKIIVHCSATKEGKAFTANDITRWHKERGFATIGYHYVVLLDGTIQQGRAEMVMGAHCKGYNANSIGVCYIGGLDVNNNPKDTRTEEQKEALLTLLKRLKADYPKATIHGHCEFSNKACPCFDAKTEYADL